MKLLQEAGIIGRDVAVIDQAKGGLNLSMVAPMWLTAQNGLLRVRKRDSLRVGNVRFDEDCCLRA